MRISPVNIPWVIGAKPAVTKFAIPPLPRTLIPRSELFGWLDDASQLPCTLVAGSPGVGKTVLLSSWISTWSERRCAWVSCDRWDNNEERLWTSIASAFSTLDTGVASDALDLLANAPDTIEDVVASLVNEFAASQAPTYLVLDDLHVTPASALDGLATFVERLPPSLHVVVASRIDPMLPLQRWRSRGLLAEIRDAELRLSEDDVAGLVKNFNLDLTRDEVRTLTGRTEGWVTGVQLAAISLRGGEDRSSFMRRFAGGEHVLADFLIEEVLSHQSEQMVTFLKATSVVDEFDGEVANFLLDDRSGAHLIREAMSSGLFLEEIGSEPPKYRYHQLFREFLRAELGGDPPTARILHSRAGIWYEKVGQYALAMDQFMEASDIDRAFDILHDHMPEAWFSGSGADLGAWVEQLPDEQILAHRWHMLDYAIALGTMGRVEEQGHWLAHASSVQGEEEDRAFQIRLAAAFAQWHGLRGETAPPCAFERDVLPHLTPGADLVLDQFPVISARAHLYEDDPAAAIGSCDSALARVDSVVSRPVLLGIKSRAMFEAGELVAARRSAEEAMEVARRSGMDTHPGLFDAVLTLGGLALEADQLEQAEHLIEEALRRCEGTPPPFEVMALVEQANLFSARCEPGEALSSLKRARGVLPAGPNSPLYSRVDVLEARIRIELGDLERAVELLHKVSSPRRRHLVEASAWLASGQPLRAQTCLSNLDAKLDDRLAIELCLLRAGIRQQMGLEYARRASASVRARTSAVLRPVIAHRAAEADGRHYRPTGALAPRPLHRRGACRRRTDGGASSRGVVRPTRRDFERAGAGSVALPGDASDNTGDRR